jgi:hypothetical protein
MPANAKLENTSTDLVLFSELKWICTEKNIIELSNAGQSDSRTFWRFCHCLQKIAMNSGEEPCIAQEYHENRFRTSQWVASV